jgi:CheY-like chemotaxis protein
MMSTSQPNLPPGHGEKVPVRPPGEERRPLSEPLPKATPEGAGRRVLVVEDSRDAAASLRLLLEVLGYDVHVAYTGPAGLVEAQAWRPEVVVCDIGLPEMDGYEVARRLRTAPGLGGVLLLALTGYGRDEDRRRAFESGFDYHLTKPADPEELRRLLRAGRPRSA